ncbi:MAG: cobalamin B12-binding domain-containing protein [Desulfosarcinaceae bacterium]
MPEELQTAIRNLTDRWRRHGLPGHDALASAAQALADLRATPGVCPLWQTPPRFYTATLDDALGQGLAIIHSFADAVGLRRHPLGLAVPADTIIAACRAGAPDLLGMTVLQFDSETDLARIRREIPATTRMVCGGPLFRADPDLADRCGIDFVAKDVGAFLEYLLDHRGTLDVDS